MKQVTSERKNGIDPGSSYFFELNVYSIRKNITITYTQMNQLQAEKDKTRWIVHTNAANRTVSSRQAFNIQNNQTKHLMKTTHVKNLWFEYLASDGRIHPQNVKHSDTQSTNRCIVNKPFWDLFNSKTGLKFSICPTLHVEAALFPKYEWPWRLPQLTKQWFHSSPLSSLPCFCSTFYKFRIQILPNCSE